MTWGKKRIIREEIPTSFLIILNFINLHLAALLHNSIFLVHLEPPRNRVKDVTHVTSLNLAFPLVVEARGLVSMMDPTYLSLSPWHTLIVDLFPTTLSRPSPRCAHPSYRDLPVLTIDAI